VTFEAHQRFVVASDVLARTVDGEAVVLDLASGAYFGLNSVGTVVFERVQAGASVDEIGAHVVAEFEVDPARAAGDVATLLAQLVAKRLIHPA
jgi:hypothetical protein